MQNREKLLVVLAVVAILLWQGMPLYSRFFVEPVEQRRADIQRLDDDVTQRNRTDRSIRRVRTNLARWKSASLPPDWRNAQRLYLEWVTDLAKMSGFTDLKVTPTPSLREGKVFTPVRVSLDAKVGYDQLCRFVDRFQKADLLHRISEMNIKKEEAAGATKLAVTLVAESLALASAEKRDHLFTQTTLKEDLSRNGTTVTVESADAFPKENQFFARSGNEILKVTSVDGAKWTVERAAEATSVDRHSSGATIELYHVVSKARPNAPAATAVDDVLAANFFLKPDQAGPQDPFESDYAKNTYLRTLWQGEQWEAWLYPQNNEKIILHEGSTFQIANLTATVVEFKPDQIMVQVEDEKRPLRLGANLQSMGKNSREGRGGGGRGGFGRGEGGGGFGGGSRGGRGGRGRGRPDIDMSDPAVREKMMECFREFREARERGEMPDFGDFGGFGGDFGGPAEAPSEGDSQNEKAAPKSDGGSVETKAEGATETKSDDSATK